MKPWISVLALGAIGSAVAPSTALACGGCFAPPGAVQVVTDHRMALSLSADRTILWDQFRYSGRPSDFSWILPIRNGPDVRIEVADNRFLTALDNLSAPVLNAPQRPYCDAEADSSFLGGARGAAAPTSAADSGVAVLQEQVVGPYMTAVVRSEDPAALRTWLRDNQYSVPAAIEPVIDYYVAQRMDFVALRLRMGEGVEQMTPIRVTTPGLSPTLPLRMIAAGVADKVGLLLMVLASSRYEAMNFPNGEVTPAQLTYDFNAPTTPADDFRRAFEALNRSNQSRLWLTESSLPVSRSTVERASQFGGGRVPVGGATVTSDDSVVAFQGIGPNATLTRLRADLGASALDRDLQLMASDLGMKDRVHTYGTVRNMPPPCGWESGPRAEFLGCAVSPGRSGGAGGMLALGLAGLGLAWRRRRRSPVSAGGVASR
ncbi:MAG: DUF2330 domain-containing protein [Myxococcaceae bacterium]|nr:MAG: DUF2330 domain-containing protein [Myxococcaceae bacterium]